MNPSSVTHNLSWLLARSAHRFPALPAVAAGAMVVHSYTQLAARVARLAAAFRAAGLAPGERVALVAKNCPEYFEAIFACWHAGLCAVPINSKLHASELVYVLQHAGARWALVDGAWHIALSARGAELPLLERITELGSAAYGLLFSTEAAEEPTAVVPTDAAWLFYTSGTTGRPKGVVLSHGNLLAMSLCFLADVEPVAPGDAILHPAPLSHGSGLYVLPHVLNAAVNVVPESGAFDPAEITALLARWPQACFFAAPTMVKRLIAHPGIGDARLDHLKSIVYGGGPMYLEDGKAAFAALGPRLAQIYGLGESATTITAMPRALLEAAIARGDDARPASVGVAHTGIEVRIGGEADIA